MLREIGLELHAISAIQKHFFSPRRIKGILGLVQRYLLFSLNLYGLLTLHLAVGTCKLRIILTCEKGDIVLLRVSW